MAPIRRSEALQPLSRQHHNGLMFCLLLGKGVARKAPLDIMKDFCMYFMQEDLSGHFLNEEVHFTALPLLYPVLTADIDKMKEDHLQIKALFEAIVEQPSYDLFEVLADKVEKHIRFEERELFNLIDSTVSQDGLQQLYAVFKDETDDNCMNYPVKFWQ